MNARNLTIVQTNDTHAYLDLHQELFWKGDHAVYRPAGGYARIAALLNQIRAENPGRVLFCDNGDTLHGTYPAVRTRGQAVVPILNALGLDAMTAHWEFAYTPEGLKQRAAELKFPILAANVYHKESANSREPGHDKETDRNGQKPGRRFFPPYLVKEINGVRIGLVGLASNIVDKTMPPLFSEGLIFTLGREELPQIVDELRSREQADLIVLISHLGFPQEMKLLSEVKGIDVCLSGHTHNRLYRPVLQGETLVVQSGHHGSFLTRLDLEVEGRRIVNYRHRLIEVEAGIEPDPAIDGLVGDALAPYKEMLSEVVGETATPLNRAASLESTMDNLLLEAVRESTGAQLAFSNGWRYGAPVPTGKITLNDLYNITPMNPPVSIVELTGEEVMAMLEENLERTFSADPYQQMGGYVKRCLGLTAYIRVENPPGRRIQRLFTGHEEVRPDRSYTAAFITQQGVPAKYGRNRQDTAQNAVDVMKAYLAAHRPVRADLQGTFTAV
ncbi:MAG: bifunctional metallophosphatase/5'-nucleotidase [Firmicutes bacterium]|nr:bifunctional metallophosphatase/5'-nucleotidase [Bacillota bacterium]